MDLIGRLHQTGRQLAVLKRMYESYALIIKRILEKQKRYRDFAAKQTKGPASGLDAQHLRRNADRDVLDDSVDLTGRFPAASEDFGPPMPQPAVNRFERLLDRINLYALNEIQECLDEKDALVFMV